MITSDPKTLVMAFIGGIIPSLLWLWFWLNEEERPEPAGFLTIVFIMGMLAVVFVLPAEQLIQKYVTSYGGDIILWAAVEEIMKYLAAVVILYNTNYTDEPIDWPIYLITAALGFAALENALYLLHPLSISETTVGLLTGQLRFLGSTLLHTISSGIIGLSIAMSYYMGAFKKVLYLILGFILAISLHSAFNFFIMRNDGNDFLKVFAFLWVVTIIVMLLFEKVRRMSETG